MTVAYHSASPEEIPKALERLYRDAAETGVTRLRAENTNVVVPLAGEAELREAEEVIGLLATLHPSRFFLLHFQPGISTFQVGVSAFCYRIGPKEEVCSEVIRIGIPEGLLAAVPSLVRSHLLPNVPSELFLVSAPPEPLLQPLLDIVDLVYLDSEKFETRLPVLREIAAHGGPVIDLQWIGLGVWRAQVKNVFDQPALAGMVKGIDRIEVRAPLDGALGRPPLKAFLMAGWLADRLHLTLEKAGPHAHDFRSPYGGAVRVAVRSAPESDGTIPSGKDLASVTISGIGRGGREAQVRLEHQEGQLTTYFRIDHVFRFSRPLEDESWEGRLKRYFQIGESIANYMPALEAGISFAESATQKRVG